MKRLFYAIYLWLIAVPVFIVLTLLTSLTTIVGCMLGGEKFFSYYPGMLWSRLTCYLLLCPVKVKGREHVRRDQSYIVVANHQGAFDIFLIYGFLGVPIKWMMKAGLAKLPFVGLACRAAGFVFVDNSTPKSAARSVLEAEKAIRKGASLAVFPEGSRTHTGKMERFKKGAFQIAMDQHLSVLPVTLNGPFDVLPSHSLRVRPHRMEMIIHPPFSPGQVEQTHQGLQLLTDQVQSVIASDLWEKYR